MAAVQLAERASSLKDLEGTIADLQGAIGTQCDELRDLQDQILRLEGSNSILLQEKAALQLQKEHIETKRDQTEQRFQGELNEKAKAIEELQNNIRRAEHS